MRVVTNIYITTASASCVIYLKAGQAPRASQKSIRVRAACVTVVRVLLCRCGRKEPAMRW